MRQAPHEVLLPASGEIQSVASDKGNPAGKPLGTGKEKRAAIKSQEKKQRRKPCADAKGTVAFSRGRCSFLKKKWTECVIFVIRLGREENF